MKVVWEESDIINNINVRVAKSRDPFPDVTYRRQPNLKDGWVRFGICVIPTRDKRAPGYFCTFEGVGTLHQTLTKQEMADYLTSLGAVPDCFPVSSTARKLALRREAESRLVRHAP